MKKVVNGKLYDTQTANCYFLWREDHFEDSWTEETLCKNCGMPLGNLFGCVIAFSMYPLRWTIAYGSPFAFTTRWWRMCRPVAWWSMR